jgi:DNA-binding transcriptional LysR family regulator
MTDEMVAMAMDNADLRVFEAVARHGSMNRAALELHTVQSNVTARIKLLEEQIGAPLFRRHARGVSLTPAGERMFPFVGRIAKLFEEAEAAARDDGEPQGSLAFGSLETTAALRLSPILSSFAKQYPKVRLTVTTGTTGSLTTDVAEFRLDGAFVAGPVEHHDLCQETVFREELVLVTSRSIRSAQDLALVEGLKTIVFHAGCSYRQRLEAFLAEMGILTAKPLAFGSIDAILSCVAAGIGVSLLPKGVVAAAWRDGAVSVHELPPGKAQVDTVFIRRNDAYVSSALAAFIEIARPRMSPTVAAEDGLPA